MIVCLFERSAHGVAMFLGFVWIPKRDPRPKLLVRDMAFADAGATTTTTKAVGKKYEWTAMFELLKE